MTQESIKIKLRSTEEDRSKMSALITKTTEVEHQLEMATNELRVTKHHHFRYI